VAWSPGSAFAADTAYTATLTLAAKAGYTFDGLADNSFSHAGASSVSYTAGSAVVTIDFAAIPLTLTRVTDLNLSPYIPAPVIGSTGIGYFTAPQYSGTVAWSPGSAFAVGTAYTATAILTPNPGYKFALPVSFAHSGGTVGTASDAGDGKVAVTIAFDALTLTPYIPKPVMDKAPIFYFTADQYTGSVVWKKGTSDHAGLFAAGTAYSAVVSLHPAAGYTLDGFTGTFTHNEASSPPAYNANDKKVTIVFPATAKRPISGAFDLTPFLTAPVIGAAPATNDLRLPLAPFTGKVKWKNGSGDHTGAFVADTVYTAEVSLEDIAEGYTLDGFTGTFTHDKASSPPTYHENDKKVTVAFPMMVNILISSPIDLTPYLPAPRVGASPATALAGLPPESPFTGEAVKWFVPPNPNPVSPSTFGTLWPIRRRCP
jgi:hypothetical protein